MLRSRKTKQDVENGRGFVADPATDADVSKKNRDNNNTNGIFVLLLIIVFLLLELRWNLPREHRGSGAAEAKAAERDQGLPESLNRIDRHSAWFRKEKNAKVDKTKMKPPQDINKSIPNPIHNDCDDCDDSEGSKNFTADEAGDVTAPGAEPYVPETNDLCVDDDDDGGGNHATTRSRFRKKSGLFCIVAGLEHSGTTMTSMLLMNAPNLYGAFECGLLMASPGNNIPDFWHNGLIGPTNLRLWGLTETQRYEIEHNASCIAEQYSLLRRYSPFFRPGGINQDSWLVDKTPLYYERLHSVMEKTPGVPVILLHKNEDEIIRSYQKRGEKPNLEKYREQLEICQRDFPERLHVLNYTAMAEDPNKIMTDAFDFLGLQWNPDYLTNQALSEKGRPFGAGKEPGFSITRSNGTGTGL